jgi:transposase
MQILCQIVGWIVSSIPNACGISGTSHQISALEIVQLLQHIEYRILSYKEIADYLHDHHGIWIDETTVGDTVRLYEVGCSQI